MSVVSVRACSSNGDAQVGVHKHLWASWMIMRYRACQLTARMILVKDMISQINLLAFITNYFI